MDKDLTLVLVGAGIAAATGIITSLIQHVLSLRADRIKRVRDQREKEAERAREMLMAGTNEMTQKLSQTPWYSEEDEKEEKEEDEEL